MAQLFRRRANTIVRVAIVGGALFFTVVCAALYAYCRSDYWTRAEEPLPQPVPFSHQHHVAGLGIDCRYCHTSVEKSAFAGMPSTEICMTCHSQVWKDAPVLEPVRDSLQTGKPLQWIRVYDLPDYVYFNHSIHVNKGIGCVNCHGRIDQMPITWEAQQLHMRWCLDCHRHPENRVGPTNEVFNLRYRPGSDLATTGPQLLLQQHVHTDGLTDCYTCHR